MWLDPVLTILIGLYVLRQSVAKTLRGIIPVPYNNEDVLKFDFVTFDRGTMSWSLLERDGPDRFQMLYARPLTKEQMDKLR